MKSAARRLQARKPDRGGTAVFFRTHGAPGIVLPFWIPVAFFLLAVLLLCYRSTTDPDLGFHIRTGEQIWRTHSIPKTDPFSFTAAGQPWISHEWLFGLAAFLIFRISGVAGLVLAKSLFVSGLFAVTAWAARVRGASPGMTILVLAVCYIVSQTRFTERPELVSLPIAVGFLLIHELGGKTRKPLLLLPLLQVIWTNVHGGTAALGIAISGFFAANCLWDAVRSRSSWMTAWNDLKLPLATWLAVVLATFLTPHGTQGVLYGLIRAKSPLVVKEFQSLTYYAAHKVDVTIALLIAYALALLTLFFLRRSSVQAYEWLLLFSLAILTFSFYRFRSTFVFLLAPSLAFQLSRAPLVGRLRWWWPAAGCLTLLAHTVHLDLSSYSYRFGGGIHPGMLPVSAGEFIRQNSLTGRMFNDYGLGGYLLWALPGETKVFIDGREDVYLGSGILHEYLTCFQSAEKWRETVSKYGIEFAVLGYPEDPPESPGVSLDAIAFPRSEWALIFSDDAAVIYAKRNGINEKIIEEKEIKTIQPLQLSTYLDEIASAPERERLFMQELDLELRKHPDSYRLHFLSGVFAVKRGPAYLEQAIDHFQKAISVKPDYVPAYFNLAMVCKYLGRVEEAKSAFQFILSLENNPAVAGELKKMQ